MGRPGRFACWWTIVRTWSPSGPGVQKRLRWHLHELDPELVIPAGALDRYRTLTALEQRLDADDGVVRDIAAELVRRCVELTHAVNDLERQILRRVAPLAPALLGLRGCGAITAAKLIGETADVRRFTSRPAFAMYNGTAPVPVLSGNTVRHRLNRGGNRQINAALHRILVTQTRRFGPARDYLQRRMSNGNTKAEAIRATPSPPLRHRLPATPPGQPPGAPDAYHRPRGSRLT